jgi:hypothetical protein
MVIDSVVMCTVTHLVDMCPPLLWVFQVTCSRPVKEAQGIVYDTFDAVVVYMKLGEYKFGVAQMVLAYLHERWEFGHALSEVLRPLTAYVIRYGEGEHDGANEGGEDNGIHISIAAR